MPRKCARVPQFNSPMKFYKETTYIPYLDFLISEFKSRFEPHKSTCKYFYPILPLFNKDANFNIDSLKPLLTKYAQFLDSPIRVFAEYERWFTYWKQKSNSKFPTTVLETLEQTNCTFYPNIYTLLKIFATIPVTTATAERSFST